MLLLFRVQVVRKKCNENSEQRHKMNQNHQKSPLFHPKSVIFAPEPSILKTTCRLNGLLQNLNDETEILRNPYMNTLSQVIGLISKESINWTEMLSNVDAQDQENQAKNDQINSQPSPKQQNQFSFELNPEMRQNSQNLQNSQVLQNSQNSKISQPVQNEPVQSLPSKAPQNTHNTQNLPEINAALHLHPISVFNPCATVVLPNQTNFQNQNQEKLIPPTNLVQNWLNEIQSNSVLATVDSAAAGIQQQFQTEGRDFQNEIKQYQMRQAIQQASNFSATKN